MVRDVEAPVLLIDSLGYGISNAQLLCSVQTPGSPKLPPLRIGKVFLLADTKLPCGSTVRKRQYVFQDSVGKSSDPRDGKTLDELTNLYYSRLADVWLTGYTIPMIHLPTWT